MPTIADLQALLQAEFDGPQLARFKRNGGVKVILETTSPTREMQVGRPCLVLSKESDTISDENGANGKLRDLTVGFEAKAADSAGGKVGVLNPSPAQIDIAQVLQDYFFNNRVQLHYAGYMMPGVRMDKDAKTDVISTSSGRVFWTYKREN